MGLSSGTVSALIVGIISAIAAPLAGIVARDYGQGDENKIAIGSAGVCIASTILIYLLALRGKTAKRGSTGYLVFFAFFTFACMCDLWLGLAIDNINPLFSFYLVNGEPYLNTAHGSGLNWWDATAHFLLYLRFIQAMIDGSDHLYAALYWTGSICGSLIIMVPAVFTGQHSGEVKASFLLNLPFILLPLFYCRLIINQESGNHLHMASYTKEEEEKLKDNKNYIRDIPIACAILGMISIYMLRFFAVFKSKWSIVEPIINEVDTLYLYDPSNYLLVHGVVQFFYVVPLYFLFLEKIILGKGYVSGTILNVAIVNFGHVCQAEFSFMKGAFHPMNKYGNLIKHDRFLTAHVGAIVISGLVAWHCLVCSNPSIGGLHILFPSPQKVKKR